MVPVWSTLHSHLTKAWIIILIVNKLWQRLSVHSSNQQTCQLSLCIARFEHLLFVTRWRGAGKHGCLHLHNKPPRSSYLWNTDGASCKSQYGTKNPPTLCSLPETLWINYELKGDIRLVWSQFISQMSFFPGLCNYRVLRYRREKGQGWLTVSHLVAFHP